VKYLHVTLFNKIILAYMSNIQYSLIYCFMLKFQKYFYNNK
jgi:hypothetical protein